MKSSGKEFIFMIILIFSATLGSGQENDFIARLKTQMLLYRTQKTDQVIILQTDKSLYRQGETIWMKGYVTDAITHALSLNSLELSVQLFDNKGTNVLEGKYLLKNGIADFYVAIPADLPSDIYYLVAYTPEMENGDIRKIFKKEIAIARPENLDIIPHIEYSKPFFAPDCKETATLSLRNFEGKPISGKKFEYQVYSREKELLSGKGKTGANGAGEVVFFTPPLQTKAPQMISLTVSSGKDRLNLYSKIPLASEKINVRFYPEGGKLVPGILQLVVYEAKDQLGNPIDIKSDIQDEQGKTIVSTSTTEHGLGAFRLLNSEAGKFSMKISSDIGKNQIIPLPPLSPGSMSLSVKKTEGTNLSLLLGKTPKSMPGKYRIVAVSNGELIWASDFDLEQSGIINVPLDNFSARIAAFAVFNEKGELVAQRLIYTGKSQSLNVTFSSDKHVYKCGEEGVIRVKVTDQNGNPVKAELAASLADGYAFPESAPAIESLIYGLEKPSLFNEPFDKINTETLDCFLVSNSLRGFDWSQVLAVDPAKSSTKRIGAIRVSGIVLDDKNLPVPDALVSLNSVSLQQFITTSDQRGGFVINLPVSIDKNSLSASATDGTGKLHFQVRLNKDFKDELVKSLNTMTIIDWHILEQMDQGNYFKANPDFFKIRPAVKVRGNERKVSEPYWKRYLTGSSNMLEILKAIRPFEMSNGKIVFRGMNSFLAQDGALIVIDGQRLGTEASQLSFINPQDVDDIRILLDPVEMGMYTGLNSIGVIEIKTKHGNSDDNRLSEIADQQKANMPKLFAPEPIGEGKYDLKTTLQWIPVLFTNEKGEATIPFKTGNIKSDFILEIAGFSNQRQWIGRRTEIKVE